MTDKYYQDNVFDNFTRPQCAQQLHSNLQQYSTYTPIMSNNDFNACDFMHGTPTNSSCADQLDGTNWMPVADIERGLKLSDKMETIEIMNKDLSPASCCSNIDTLIPDFYKSFNKDANFYNKSTSNESQWYCNVNYNNQKYMDYPSCSQVIPGNNFMTVEDKSTKCFSLQKPNDFTYTNMQCMQQYDCNYYNQSQFNILDINHEQFYNQNEPLPFSDINNIDQRIAEESNCESDIIVEESDEDVTDYSEDLEKKCEYSTNCIICNIMYTPVGNQFYILNSQTPLTMSSQQPVFGKLTEIVGTVNNTRNYLCSYCLNLINTIDNLQLKLESSKLELYNKYEKTCKQNNVKFNNPLNSKTKSNRIVKNRLTRKFKHFCGIHSFKCKLCKKLFSIKRLYELHMSKHKTKNRYLCEQCGQRFSKFCKFKYHLKLHKKVIFKKPQTLLAYLCKTCKKMFRTKTNLTEHENYCSGYLPYVCTHSNCDKKFPTTTKLKNHIKLKHDMKFVAICSICNIGFVKLSDYKSHKTTHSTEKKFNCTKCEKSYKTISNLNYHMKFHNDKLPFVCDICNKGFMRKEYLESHINNHNGLKNFSCQVCGKKFVSQKNLDAHVKYHEGTVKKKVCNICNKTMTTGFEEHLRTHSNLREFECEMCFMKFNTKSALAKHKKRKHAKGDYL